MSTFAGFVDDASALGAVSIHDATSAYAARPATDATYVGRLVLSDTDLPLVRGVAAPLHVVLGGGAGQIGGPSALARRLGLDLAAVETTLRDLDDPTANVRRVSAAVDAARSAGELGETVEVHVAVPTVAIGPSWPGALDEIAAAGLGLVLPADGSSGDLLAWIDAALDRELAFRCSGLVRADGEPRGFRNVLAATALLFDTLPGAADALTGAEESGVDLTRGRRWFTGFASVEPDRSVADLRALEAAR